MSTSRPYLLLSNDDGYQALGLNYLIDALRADYDLLVVAPDGPRSGYSCAFTASHPVSARLVRKEEGLTVLACSGTPVDCVKAGLHRYAERRPDLVVGGINHGDNSAVNACYSGTMGVAGEAALQGVPAIAFSLCDHRHDADFSPMLPYLAPLTQWAIDCRMPEFTCLNANFPLAESYKGVRLCRMAKTRWVKEIEPCEDGGRGGDWFWMSGYSKELEPDDESTDRWALEHGYVAVTPTTMDKTSYELLHTLDLPTI